MTGFDEVTTSKSPTILRPTESRVREIIKETLHTTHVSTLPGGISETAVHNLIEANRPTTLKHISATDTVRAVTREDKDREHKAWTMGFLAGASAIGVGFALFGLVAWGLGL